MDSPQSWNRYSYVLNDPIRFNDPTGHRPDDDGPPPPPIISYTKEDGLCVKFIGCSGGESYRRWWKSHWLPKIERDVEKSVSTVVDVIGFGSATKDRWTETKTSPKFGFGLDVAKQLISDASRKDLTWEQRLTRAGLSGVEGLAISEISSRVATQASKAVLEPSISLAVETEQLWIPPVAVAATWTVTYIATNWALSYVSNIGNEALTHPNP